MSRCRSRNTDRPRIVVPTYEEQRRQETRARVAPHLLSAAEIEHGEGRHTVPFSERSRSSVLSAAVCVDAAARQWLRSRMSTPTANVSARTSNANTNLGIDTNFNFNLNANFNSSVPNL
jgi:hypothetical protein